MTSTTWRQWVGFGVFGGLVIAVAAGALTFVVATFFLKSCGC